MNSLQSFQRLSKIAILAFIAGRCYADPILSVTFDDPKGLFTEYPEGISLREFQTTPTIKEAEVATGLGGKGFLHIDTTEWVEGSAEPPPKSFELLSDEAMGTKAFLRLNNYKEVPGTRGFAVIRPDTPETSLGSLSQINNGKVTINGGLDVFFRYSEENPSQQELVPNLLATGGEGLRLTVEADGGSVVAVLSDDKNETLFDTDQDGSADANRAKTEFVKAAPIESEVPYHLAITLETSDAGVVTMKVFLKQGTGAINTKQDEDLVSQGSFSVITDNADKVLYDGAISIGANSRTSPTRAILDLAAFRIFQPAPAVFPDVSGKE
jgi:hypothetical protein